LIDARARVVALLWLPRLVATAFVLCRLRRRALLMPAAVIRSIRAVTAASAVTAPASMHTKSVLAAVALVVTILRGILLWLTAAGNKCRQAADVLPAFLAALVRLMRLLLVLRAIVYLLVARRKRLGVAREIRLLLGFARAVARFVLAHERLTVIIIAVEAFVVALLVLSAGRSLLRLLIVVGVLLAELFLRGGDETEIMFGVLVVILSGNGIAGALRVARELNIFFRNVRSRAADLNVRAV
jgi:hypothetical protein